MFRRHLLALRQLIIDGGIVRQHVFLAKKLRKHIRRLLDDRRIRDHINHARHFPCRRVFQRKRKRRERLSAAGRNGQRIKALLPRASPLHAGAQRRVALPAYNAFASIRQIPRRALAHPAAQLFNLRTAAARHGRAVHKRLRILKIRVDQTRVDHSRVKRIAQGIAPKP